MSNDLPSVIKQGLLEKGLTEDEAVLVADWVKEGKPGLSAHRAERLGEIYCLGYSCQEIRKWIPEYPLELLLWARATYNWDELRTKYRQVVQQETLNAALSARMESIRFLSDALTATHIKWRKEILAYIQDPDKYEKPPQILPSNLHTYGFLINTLKEITAPFQTEAKDEKSLQLVSVNINSSDKDPSIEVKKATSTDIKNALMAEVRKRGKAPDAPDGK